MIIQAQYNFKFTIHEASYTFSIAADTEELACQKLKEHLASIIYELNTKDVEPKKVL